MNFLECIKGAFQNVLNNKLRSLLTMLGIIIGISSVIIIVSLGEGGKKYISQKFEGVGSNALTLKVNGEPGEDLSKYYFKKSDILMLQDKIPEITDVSPITQDFGSASTIDSSKKAAVIGTSQGYKNIINATMLEGRFLSESDVESSRSSVVIDSNTSQKLFPAKTAIGEKITVRTSSKSATFTVVGVFKDPRPDISPEMTDAFPGIMLVPYTISNKILTKPDISTMFITLDNMNSSQNVSNKVTHLLENKYKAPKKYTIEKALKEVELLQDVLSMFTLVIGAIAAISLLVGGIGVMNIMLVSVTERTREIGIRKALGAKRRDILYQFLTESLIICIIGGIIGISIGVAFSLLVGNILGVGLTISMSSLIISFLFSSMVGIFFGIYPANKASKLNPIDALRYE